MEMPEYITIAEVQRVCKVLGLRDWTVMGESRVTVEEAQKLLDLVNVEKMPVGAGQFRMGLEVELEHGVMYPDANVTNNHPVLTAKIVLAHLKEALDYYERLDVAEIEGDMAKAAAAGNANKLMAKYRKLVEAKRVLAEAESRVAG
jgi:hypothetical protein